MVVELSPSRFNLFAECRRCFWLRVNHGIERPSGPFPSLPGGMDRVIKAQFDRFRAEGVLPPELRGEVDARLVTDQRFLDRCRQWRGTPTYVDETLDVVLRGGVDDLLRDADGALVVLDYKTRGYPPRADDRAPDYYARQVDCYNLLLRSNGYSTADRSLLLYYSPDEVARDAAVRFHTEVRRVPVDVDGVRTDVERAVEALRGPIPEPDSDCPFCQWNVAEFEA